MAEFDQSIVAIDDHDLAREWLEHPSLVVKWGIAKADAEHSLAQAKLRLEVVEGDLYRKIRADPEGHGLTAKATEAAVRAAYIRNKDFLAAHRRMVEASRLVAYHAAVMNGLEHRRRALENRVRLLEMDYHADPRPPKNGQMQDRVNDRRRRMAESSMPPRNRGK